MKRGKVTTLKGFNPVFEDIIRRHGPKTANGLVSTAEQEYVLTRVSMGSDRAAQYLIRNNNIVVIGKTPANLNIYGLRGIEYEV